MKRSRFKEQVITILREYEAGHKTEDFVPKRGIRSASFPRSGRDVAVSSISSIMRRTRLQSHANVRWNGR